MPLLIQFPIPNILKAVISFFAVLLFLSVSYSLFANEEAGKEEKSHKDRKLTKIEIDHLIIKGHLEKIRKLREATPVDHKAIAETYILIFNKFHAYEQGKMAAWEAYEIYVSIKDYTNATALLTMIMSVYGYEGTMENPLDKSMPVSLRATARIELAKLYAKRGDLLTALSISRSVAIQHSGVYVGRFSGEKTYYGKVEIISTLQSIRFSLKSKNYNQGFLTLLDLIRNNKGEVIGNLYGKVDLEAVAVELGRDIIVRMPASQGKSLSLFRELAGGVKSRLALSRVHFYRAGFFIDAYKKTRVAQRLEESLLEYKILIARFPDVVEQTEYGHMPAGIAAIIEIRDLFVTHGKDNNRALYELSTIEKEHIAKEDPFAKTIAAYASYYKSMVFYQQMGNYKQAIYFLEVLASKYPDVLMYPVSKTKKPSPKLVEHVQKMIKVIQSRVL